MAFEDLFSTLTSAFTGGTPPINDPNAGATPAATGGFAPTQADQGFSFKDIMPLLIGGGSMLASKLMGRGLEKDISQATKGMKRGAGTAGAAGQLMVDRASRGELTDPQKAAVEKMKREQNARMQQRFAELGIPVSTMQSQSANQIDQEAEAFSQKLINDSFEQGIKALGLGTTASQALLTSAMKQKEDLAKTIGEVAKQMGMIFNKPPQTPTTPGQQPQPSANAQVPTEWASFGDPYTDVPIQEETV